MVIVLRDTVVPTDGGSQLISGLVDLTTVPHIEVVLSTEDWGFATNLVVRLCYGRLFRVLRRYPPFVWLFMLVFYGVLRRILQGAVLRRFHGRGVSGVWCPANDILPLIGAVVAQGLGCPLHVSVTDLPETYALHESERSFLRRRRRLWLALAQSCDLASEGMRLRLEKEEGRVPRSLVIWSSPGIQRQAPGFSVRRQLRVIAFCGSMRFREELLALVRGLEAFADRQGRRVLLRLFTKHSFRSSFVDWRGYLHHHTQLATELVECDAGYSPMAFADRDRLLVMTSFPGKITTYLGARLPIIAHGPEYATNVAFVESLDVGLALRTRKEEEIAGALELYESQVNLRAHHSANTETVVNRYFSPASRAQFLAEVLI